MKGRRRLPLASSSLNTSTSLRLSTATIERTRKEIIAEEYLTHVGEALQWVEGVLQKDLGFGVVEFEEKLRDGVILARVAEAVGAKGCERIFEVGRPSCVARSHSSSDVLFQNPKLQWRHSDNIILFLQFTQSPEVGLPKNFIFETIDLYEKKNLPKVIFCIHSLRCVRTAPCALKRLLTWLFSVTSSPTVDSSRRWATSRESSRSQVRFSLGLVVCLLPLTSLPLPRRSTAGRL